MAARYGIQLHGHHPPLLPADSNGSGDDNGGAHGLDTANIILMLLLPGRHTWAVVVIVDWHLTVNQQLPPPPIKLENLIK